MDVLFFLKARTRFIRQFYETAGEPFREIMRKIDAEEAPMFLDFWKTGRTVNRNTVKSRRS